MRALILVLALLAVAKIWIQDTIYRSSTEQALVSAYRAQAASACAAVSEAKDGANEARVWAGAEGARISVGNPAVRVHIWEFDHALWDARFRQPYLVLSSGPGGLSCTYDLIAGTAEVARS